MGTLVIFSQLVCLLGGLEGPPKELSWPPAVFAAGTDPLSLSLQEDEAIWLLSNDRELAIASRVRTEYALESLKALRSAKAVPILCKRLLCENLDLGRDGLPRPDKRYLVYPVLVEIGRPAVAGLLEEIASTETTRQYRGLSLSIIQDIVGEGSILEEILCFRKQCCPTPEMFLRLLQLEAEYQAELERSKKKS